jgi:hypothetical protein
VILLLVLVLFHANTDRKEVKVPDTIRNNDHFDPNALKDLAGSLGAGSRTKMDQDDLDDPESGSSGEAKFDKEEEWKTRERTSGQERVKENGIDDPDFTITSEGTRRQFDLEYPSFNFNVQTGQDKNMEVGDTGVLFINPDRNNGELFFVPKVKTVKSYKSTGDTIKTHNQRVKRYMENGEN